MNAPNFPALLRPHIAAMEPYTPIVPFDVLSARLGRDPKDIVKLDANENPYGPSPKVLEALAKLEYPHIYPDPESTALRAALAKDTGLPAENLLAGSGADELIDLVMRAFLNPGDAIVNCPPTFGMYPFDADVNAAQVITIPRRADFSVDVETVEVESQKSKVAKLIFLASPNNPDGSVLPDDDLHRLLALPLMVVLDEAYVEFHGVSRISWVLEHENLIVLRTFSKRAGLAGMRVGYGAFPLWLMPHLWKFKQPYNVTVASSVAAIAALEDGAYLAQIVQWLTDERERLFAALQTIPFLKPYPSRSNFILCRVIGRDARELKLALERDGILVRHYTSAGLRDCIRISVGKPEHTARLIKAIAEC
jgi:histidinol-phosphate aminotransferase